MAREGRTKAVLETSVLVNFLAVDRVDLLAHHPKFQFVLTDHVKGEVTSHYPEQVTRLQAALDQSLLEVASVDSFSPTFAILTKEYRYGVGECAAIAFVVENKLSIAIDDKRAANAGKRISSSLQVYRNNGELNDLARQEKGTRDQQGGRVEGPVGIEHRFRLPFASFKEKMGIKKRK